MLTNDRLGKIASAVLIALAVVAFALAPLLTPQRVAAQGRPAGATGAHQTIPEATSSNPWGNHNQEPTFPRVAPPAQPVCGGSQYAGFYDPLTGLSMAGPSMGFSSTQSAWPTQRQGLPYMTAMAWFGYGDDQTGWWPYASFGLNNVSPCGAFQALIP